MKKRGWKRITIAASVVIVIIIIVPSLLYYERGPRISVTDGSNTMVWKGEIGSSNASAIFNQTWANSTILLQSGSKSVFYLCVGPGSVYQYWNDNYAEWSAAESFQVMFGGIINGKIHPKSVTLLIGTNGTNADPSVNLEGSFSTSANVSFSNQNTLELSFLGNKTAYSTFMLQNITSSVFSPSEQNYTFSYATTFIVLSSIAPSFTRYINLNVTLNGLSVSVYDDMLFELAQGVT